MKEITRSPDRKMIKLPTLITRFPHFDIVTASIHTQQTFQLHFIRRELVVGKTWVTKLQNAPCNDAKSTTLKMQVARETKFHIVHTYVVVRSLPF